MSETSQINQNSSSRKIRSFSLKYRAVGMVSFVDVLANGLIVMILLIFITLKVNKEIKQEEEQSMKEIGVMMSRKIAASLTSNAIPTNPPAFLHDYKNSSFDMFPQEHIMPVIELHENFVRFFYSGQTVSYQSLFEKDNGLDHYLSGLTNIQKLQVRIDLYAIRPYYITMSILKEHGIQIRHWHILGYSEPPPPENAYKKSGNPPEIINKNTDLTSDIADNSPIGDKKSDSPPRYTLPGDLQENQDMLDEQADSENQFAFPELDLKEEEMRALGKFLSELQKMLPFLPNAPDLNNQNPMNKQQLKEYLERLAKELAQQGNNAPMFRIPDETVPQLPFMNPMNRAQPNVPDLLVTVSAMLHYLQKKQTAYDSEKMTDISVNEFMITMGIFQTNRKLMENLPYFPLALNIYARFMETLDQSELSGELNIEQKITDETYSENELNVKKNQFPENSLLLSEKNQKRLDFFDKPASKQTQLTIRRYPTYYKGETIELGENTIIIVPPYQKTPSEFRWRLIGVLKSDLKDTVMGYTYSAFDGNGQMVLPTLENSVSLDNTVIKTVFPEKVFDHNAILLVFYICGALIILVLFIKMSRT